MLNEDIEMAYKYTEMYSITPVISELQIKTTKAYYNLRHTKKDCKLKSKPTHFYRKKKKWEESFGDNMEKKKPYTVKQKFQKIVSRLLFKKLKIELSYDSEIPL